MLILPDSATLKHGAITLGTGHAAVPNPYHKDYKSSDGWRDDIPFIKIQSKINVKTGGEVFGVLLAPFKKTAPKVEVKTVNPENRLQVHKVIIKWEKYVDTLIVDYRKEKPVFSITRTNNRGKVLWSE